MSETLLEQFVQEEDLGYVRTLLAPGAEPPIRRFEFNRFDVTVDYDRSVVVIDDVLSVDESGSEVVSLRDFLRAVGMEL